MNIGNTALPRQHGDETNMPPFVLFRVSNKRQKTQATKANKYKCECTVCGKLFAESYSLRRHLKNVHKMLVLKLENDYKCRHCELSYSTKKSLVVHVRQKHSSTESVDPALSLLQRTNTHCGIICPECSVVFPLRRRLREHLTASHGVQFQPEKLVFQCRDGKYHTP